jgi:hypothetical protein
MKCYLTSHMKLNRSECFMDDTFEEHGQLKEKNPLKIYNYSRVSISVQDNYQK